MAGKEKVTTMVLKVVNLQCYECYKKVKKALCKFPQIRDQIYDEKQNQVVIKVVCCSPEKIRDRICCKGGGAIKSIEIIEPEKTKLKEQEKSKQTEKPKETEKTKQEPETTKEQEPKQTEAHCPVVHEYPQGRACCMDCYHGRPGGPCQRPPSACCMDCYHGRPGGPCQRPPSACCMDCYNGRMGGPCQTGYSGPVPYIQDDGYCGRPIYESYGGGRSYNNNYCFTRSDCFNEDNPQGCIVM